MNFKIYARRLFSKIVGVAYDLPKNLFDLMRIILFRAHHKIKLETDNGQFRSGNIAILAIFPSVPTFWNVVNIASQLNSNGYEVLVVSSKELDDPQREELKPYCVTIIERSNIGRDFGSYNCGLHWLKTQKISIEKVLLLNDSVFYPSNFKLWIKKALYTPGFGGLTVNNQFYKHVQGFFIFADHTILQSKAWRNFWKYHLPFSSRSWNINAGEYGLSSSIAKAGFPLIAMLNSTLFLKELDRCVFTEKSIPNEGVRELIFYRGLIPIYEPFNINLDRIEQVMQQPETSKAINRARREYLELADYLLNNQNPFWTLALPLSYYLDMPLKKDLVRRAGYLINWLLDVPGFSRFERTSIAEYYERRGSRADVHGFINTMLFDQGRKD
jgi:hypothetical protein